MTIIEQIKEETKNHTIEYQFKSIATKHILLEYIDPFTGETRLRINVRGDFLSFNALVHKINNETKEVDWVEVESDPVEMCDDIGKRWIEFDKKIEEDKETYKYGSLFQQPNIIRIKLKQL